MAPRRRARSSPRDASERHRTTSESISAERFRIPIAMTREAYADYMMTETNVAAAIRRGVPAGEVRDWCGETLESIWSDDRREILFNGYFAQLRSEAVIGRWTLLRKGIACVQ